MSLESAKACVEKLKADPAFGKSLEGAPGDEARKRIMKDAGFDFTREELMQALGVAAGRELKDEDLEKVSGGFIVAIPIVPAVATVTV